MIGTVVLFEQGSQGFENNANLKINGLLQVQNKNEISIINNKYSSINIESGGLFYINALQRNSNEINLMDIKNEGDININGGLLSINTYGKGSDCGASSANTRSIKFNNHGSIKIQYPPFEVLNKTIKSIYGKNIIRGNTVGLNCVGAINFYNYGIIDINGVPLNLSKSIYNLFYGSTLVAGNIQFQECPTSQEIINEGIWIFNNNAGMTLTNQYKNDCKFISRNKGELIFNTQSFFQNFGYIIQILNESTFKINDASYKYAIDGFCLTNSSSNKIQIDNTSTFKQDEKSYQQLQIENI